MPYSSAGVTVILALIVLGIQGLRALVVLVNLVTRQWLHSDVPARIPRISVLLPARNEEASLGNLLEGLRCEPYSDFEVLVYDDASTDETASLALSFEQKIPGFRLIKGAGEPPAGWLGKNFACHQLALQAKGEYLLFLDADVLVEPGFLSDLISHSLNHNLHLLSLFPVQKMHTPGERLLVPLMNRILVSMLPLVLTRVSRKPSLSAANGQVMLFRGDTYREHMFHQAVKGRAIEDIRIFRMMKQLRLRSQTLLSGGQVSCRMYHGYSEALTGFSKNIFQFFGGSVAITLLYALFTTFGWIPVVMSADLRLIGLWVFLALLTNLVTSSLSRQSLIRNLLLSAPQQGALIHLIFQALRFRIRGGYLWKGRKIDQD